MSKAINATSELSLTPIDEIQYDDGTRNDINPTNHNDFNRLIKNNLQRLSPETDRFVRQNIEAIYDQLLKYGANIDISIATNRKDNLEKYLSLLLDEVDYSSTATSHIFDDTNIPIDEMITVLGTVDTQRKVDKEAISNVLNVVEIIRQAVKNKLSNELHIENKSETPALDTKESPILTTEYEIEKSTTTKSIEDKYTHADILLKIANLHLSGKSKEALEEYTKHTESYNQTDKNTQKEVDFVLNLLKQDEKSAKAIIAIRKAYSQNYDKPLKEKMILAAKSWQNFDIKAFEQYSSFSQEEIKKQKHIIVDAIKNKEEWVNHYISLRQKYRDIKKQKPEYTARQNMIEAANLLSQGKVETALKAYKFCIEFDKNTGEQNTLAKIIEKAKSDKSPWLASFAKLSSLHRANEFLTSEKTKKAATTYKLKMELAETAFNSGKHSLAFKILDDLNNFAAPKYTSYLLAIRASENDKERAKNIKQLISEYKSYTSLKKASHSTTEEIAKDEGEEEAKKSIWENVTSKFSSLKKSILPEKNTTNKTISENFNSLSFKKILSFFGWKKQKTTTTPTKNEPYIAEKPISTPTPPIAEKQDETPKNTNLVVKFEAPSKIDEENIPTLQDVIPITPPRQLKVAMT